MKNNHFARFLPNLTGIILTMVFLGVILLGPKLFSYDGDLGRHITIGNFILDRGEIPLQDEFSWTMYGEMLVPHEWMADVFFALANRMMGLNGVVILTALIISGTIAFIFNQCLTRSGQFFGSLLLILLGAGASSIHWLARPHIFTFMFLAFWIALVEKLLKDRRTWLGLPAAMMIWVNFHGAFLAGFMVLGMYCAGLLWEYLEARQAEEKNKRRKQMVSLVLAGGAALLTSFINPAGYRVWNLGVGYLQNTYLVNGTQEYRSPDFHIQSAWPFLLLIGLSLVLVSIMASHQKLRKADVLMLSGWTVMALFSARNIPLYVVAVVPILCQVWGKLEWPAFFRKRDERLLLIENSPRLPAWYFAVMVLAVIFLLGKGIPMDLHMKGNQFDATIFPVKAVDWLEKNPQSGNGYNEFFWGGYLLYRLWPEQKVFIDGQTDFYGEQLTRDYMAIREMGDGWQTKIEDYQIDWMIIPTKSNLAQTLMNDQNWNLLYQDETAVVLQHER